MSRLAGVMSSRVEEEQEVVVRKEEVATPVEEQEEFMERVVEIDLNEAVVVEKEVKVHSDGFEKVSLALEALEDTGEKSWVITPKFVEKNLVDLFRDFEYEKNISTVPLTAVMVSDRVVKNLESYGLVRLFDQTLASSMVKSAREEGLSEVCESITEVLGKGRIYEESIVERFVNGEDEYKILKLNYKELAMVRDRFREYGVQFFKKVNEHGMVVDYILRVG